MMRRRRPGAFSIHLRKEEAAILKVVARHRMMSPKLLVQDIVCLGLLGEAEKLKKMFGDDWEQEVARRRKENVDE